MTLWNAAGARIHAQGIDRAPALLPQPSGQSEAVAVASLMWLVPCLGQTGLGVAILDGTGTIRALPSGAGPAA
jgi:hypothetical protein